MTWADEVLTGHPFVVAHRGASAARPEHTLAAYDLALKEGADGVECDVRLTRDGHLVCVHDRRLDRTSTGAGLVSTMGLAVIAGRQANGFMGCGKHFLPQGDTLSSTTVA
jgi:glycerophosphoryl diester phosphodiesterase